MFRSAIIFLILTSMMLHCASRLNILSYLYKQRHAIAYQIGLIAEIPIAMCSSAYEFNKGLIIETHDDEKSSLPAAFSQAREIILFFQLSPFNLNPRTDGLVTNHLTMVQQRRYIPPGIAIFHPPV